MCPCMVVEKELAGAHLQIYNSSTFHNREAAGFLQQPCGVFAPGRAPIA